MFQYYNYTIIILSSQLSSQINNTFPEDNQPLTTKSDEIPFFNKSNLNKSCSNITNNNNNIMIFNSNLSEIENINSSNELTPIPKEIEIEKIKITNEILKKINIMNKNKLYFTNKYIQNSKNENNLEEKYKNLLNKLINYNLDIRSLIEINSDLIKFQTKNKKNNNNEKPKTNYKSYSPFILEPNESKEFKSNLRIYNNEKTNQKPFLNYTSPYGQLFS